MCLVGILVTGKSELKLRFQTHLEKNVFGWKFGDWDFRQCLKSDLFGNQTAIDIHTSLDFRHLYMKDLEVIVNYFCQGHFRVSTGHLPFTEFKNGEFL